MHLNKWQPQFDASQKKLLPLLTISFLCVQILSSARLPIVMGQAPPTWLLAANTFFILCTAGIALWARSDGLADRLSHPIVAVAYLIAGLSLLAGIAAQQDPLPFYFAMVMLAGSLCFLSQRYLLACMFILVLLWIPVAYLYLTVSQAISSLFICAIGSALSYAILRRRILQLVKIFELESRVLALESILPMCANCKKTRDALGNWQSIEEYIEGHQEGTQVSHGSCPSCTEELYGDLLRDQEKGN